MSNSPKSRAKQLREPPPSLFLGPPSQNASHISLSNTLPAVPAPASTSLNPTRAPLIRQRSQRAPRSNIDGGTDSNIIPPLPRPTLPRQQQVSEGQKQADRTDALWAEMQTTLEEVELSAVNTTHVFGAEHSRALEALRTSQIALAQAWARSEADDAVEGKEENKIGRALLGSDGKTNFEGTDPARSTAASGSARPGSSGGVIPERLVSMEEETEIDILLARKRREANDRYFQRVNGGVLDVVAKLEEVALAMKSVDQESRDIWGDNDSASVHDGSI